MTKIKVTFTVATLSIAVILFNACQNISNSNQTSNTSTIGNSDNADKRPKEEIYFLNKVKEEMDIKYTSNAIDKDRHINNFNKYANDSLKNISHWEMIVDEIDDNPYSMNSFASKMLNTTECYNIKLVSPIKIDNTTDTIGIDNQVNYTYTIPKNPKSAELKKQLSILKSLKAKDTVIVSGSLTHLNNNNKVDFRDIYEGDIPWNIDLLAVDLSKKESNK